MRRSQKRKIQTYGKTSDNGQHDIPTETCDAY